MKILWTEKFWEMRKKILARGKNILVLGRCQKWLKSEKPFRGQIWPSFWRPRPFLGFFDPKMTKNGGWGPPLTKPIALRRDLPGYLVLGGKAKSGVFWPTPKKRPKSAKIGSFSNLANFVKKWTFLNSILKSNQQVHEIIFYTLV